MILSAKNLFMLFCAMFFLSGNAEAAWWDIKVLPVPPQTEQLKEKSRKSAHTEFDVSFYESRLGRREIVDFYRRRLIAEGWQERNPALEMGKISDLDVGGNIDSLTGSTLIFRRDNEMIVVRFIGEGTKTKYILGKNKISPAVIPPTPNMFSIQRSEASLRKEIAPRYPDAEMISASEEPSFQRLVYLSNAQPAVIADYYKGNMGAFGWKLEQDKPVQRIKYPEEAQNKDRRGSCPACDKKINELMDHQGVEVKELGFINSAGETCHISVLKVIPVEKNSDVSNYTIITVAYEKN